MTFRGLVESVDTVNAGDFIAVAAASGATTITVDNTDIFETDDLTGQVQINGVTYGYTNVDEDLSTLTLASPLTGAVVENDRVSVFPLTPETSAQIVLDDTDGAITARIPTHLATLSAIADGIRDTNQREVVVVDLEGEDVAVVTEIVNEAALVNGAQIDPTSTIPPKAMSDGLAPASSPTPVTIGGLRQVFVKWDPVVNQDLTTYEVHVTATAGAPAPTAGSASTLVTTTPGTMVAVAALPDGTPFVYDNGATPPVQTNYYFAVIAKDADGAATPGPWVPGHMDKTAAGDLVAGSVTTETLNSVIAILGTLQIGGNLIELSPPTTAPDGSGGVTLAGGIIIKDPADPTGEPLVRLHPNGSTFRGKLEADILTVLQNLLINGDARLSGGSTFTVAGGVPDPLTGPSWSVGSRFRHTWPAAPSGLTSFGFTYDQTNNRWVEQLEDSLGYAYFRTVSLTGTPGNLFTVPSPTGITTQNPRGSRGLVVHGGNLIFGLAYFNPTNSRWELYAVRCTFGGTFVDSLTLTTNGGSNLGFGPGPTGTFVTVFSNTIQHRNSSDYSLVASAAFTAIPLGLQMGDFDYGGQRILTVVSGSVNAYTVNWTTQTTAAAAANGWTSPQNFGLGASVVWTGSEFNSLFLTNSGVHRWSGFFPGASDGTWSAVYVDKNGSGTTKPSPATTATMGRRYFATLTLPALQSGTTSSSVWVGHAASGNAATKYLRAETMTGRSMQLAGPKQTSGSTVIPSTNTAGGPAAVFRSEATSGWVGGGLGDFSVRTPTAAGHAVNKSYADGLVLPRLHSRRNRTTTLATTTAVGIAVPFNVVDTETGISYGTTAWTIPRAGVYTLTGTVSFTANATGARVLDIEVNGSGVARGRVNSWTPTNNPVSVSTTMALSAGDTVEFVALQNSGGSLNLVASAIENFASVTFVSA